MYEITGFHWQHIKMKIICSYLACREFIPVPITDDESLDIVFDMAQKPGTNCLELYLEREPASIDSQVNITTQIHVDNQVIMPVCYDNPIVVDGDKCNANPNTFLDPGPSDKSMLVLQHQYRSEAICYSDCVLTCRQRLGTMMREWQLDHRIHHFVVEAGFYRVCRIVTGSADLQWDDLCEELLGVRTNPSVLHDKSGLDVQLIFFPLLRDFKYAGKFSWGSVVLAYLYRELYRAKQDPVDPDDEAIKNQVQVSEVEMANQETLPADPLGCRTDRGLLSSVEITLRGHRPA
ncbi:hypothetical protein Patl1_14731 [Pistacia atlantica]|uniref:Uncharacterized protein n=1 Tax=Pistacia atlantica TaxID=434234 RepID=A0ACC1AU58_9ROSI|nr:hypothetical protein Patl1_14731 [Pistacia atlantica]